MEVFEVVIALLLAGAALAALSRHIGAPWVRVRELWRGDSIATEQALASLIADVYSTSEEEAQVSAVLYRRLSGRLGPLLYPLYDGQDVSMH